MHATTNQTAVTSTNVQMSDSPESSDLLEQCRRHALTEDDHLYEVIGFSAAGIQNVRAGRNVLSNAPPFLGEVFRVAQLNISRHIAKCVIIQDAWSEN